VEVISLSCSSIAIIPMVSMFDAGLRAAVLGGNYDQARTLANEKLEEVKALFSGSCPLSRGQYRQLQRLLPVRPRHPVL